MDKLTKEQRSANMKAVKSKDSKIERMLAKALWAKGFRYRKNYSKIIGKPDIVFPSLKIAIFCDSEFWHGKNWKIKKKEIKSNRDFWYRKIERNIERDKEVNRELRRLGWKIIRFWGSSIEKRLDHCVAKVERIVKERKPKSYSEIKKKLKIKINEETNNKLAFITHYLQNREIKEGKYFKQKAEKYLYKTYDEPSYVNELLLQYNLPIEWDVPFPPPANPKFTFIDLFAGIGGFRIAFQNLHGKCVFSSEIDKYSIKTYEANFGEVPFGDITKIKANDIPDHDILLAGFPCQAFSIAGRKKGFNDTRGTLFFDIARILRVKRPKAFLLENVKGLIHHDGGRTIKRILEVLRDELNYYVPAPEIMNAKYFGVPQNRERIFIVGFRRDLNIKEFKYPLPTNEKVMFSDIKEKNPVSVKYYLSKQYLKTLKAHRARHESKGNGFGFEIISDNGVANAIVVGGMGRERNLVHDDRLNNFTPVTNIKGMVNREGIRRMTPREWARLQGFPEEFIIESIVSDAQAYKQFGNSVAIPLVQAIGKKILQKLFNYDVLC
jgi:DNA (cytosine-5)-methyltransferase 1